MTGAHEFVKARGAERVAAVVVLNRRRCRFELTAPMASAAEAAY